MAAADIVPGRKTWHQRVGGVVDPARADAWRARLSAQQVRLVEVAAAAGMRRGGYSSSGTPGVPRVGDLSEYASIYLWTRLWLRKRRLADARLRRRFPMPLAAAL
jgi:hypothetical protein